MIKHIFGITIEPFCRESIALLPQQEKALEFIKVHSQHGGFSVIMGQPGVGKTILRRRIEALGSDRDAVVCSASRTMHTYGKITREMALSLKLEPKRDYVEDAIINAAFEAVGERKTIYTLIDEAHLLDMAVLRKLRLLFERFPKKHNLVLFGQPELMQYLSMIVNTDIKSRITYSQTLIGLNDADLTEVIFQELDAVGLGHNVFDDAAIELILRQAQGNLRLMRNLCYGGLIEACREGVKTVLTRHINAVLIQPHWRSHEELLQQQAQPQSPQQERRHG